MQPNSRNETTDNKIPEQDALMERVDKHLADDYLESMSESLPYRMGSAPVILPPLWLAIVIVLFLCVVGYLFRHFDVWLPS